jgi:ABC-2 type transport system permease protein
MTGANILARDTSGPLGNPQTGPWNSFTINFVFFLWCLVALPLLVALETALLAGVEHRENAWKHLFALPVPRWSLYAAKLVVGTLLLAASSVTLAVGVGLEGLALNALRPTLGLSPPVPWGPILSAATAFSVAALCELAIQTWVAIRWRSFPLAVGLGIAGTVAGLVLGISPRSAAWASVFPWSLPFIAVPRPEPLALALSSAPSTALVVGTVGGLLVAVLGCWDVCRRDVV